MPEPQCTAETIAPMIKNALENGDLDAISALLDPDVRWGAPDDLAPSCQNREQVLVWYRRGRDAGARARVTEATVYGDKILVGLRVAGRQGNEAEALRWQVLTVGGQGVVDIRGFDDRDVAVARATRPS